MRELDRRRRELVPALVARAAELGGASGQPVSATVRRELTETLTTAVATEAAAAAVTSGMLTRALAYSGFGDVDVEAAAALPRPSSEHAVLRPAPGDGDAPGHAPERDREARALRRAAEDALAAAEAELSTARSAADDATRAEQAARERRDEATALVANLEQHLAEARDTLRAARAELAAATAESARFDAARRTAGSAVAERRRALDDLSG
jgi:hypothetical protein